MCFNAEEIRLARKLRDLGLSWEPQVGQYVWDEDGVIDQPSLVQDRVHLIHDLRYFQRQAGSKRGLKDTLCWLPTWREARQLLRSKGLSDLKVLAALVKSDALEQDSELAVLYQLLADELSEARTTSFRRSRQELVGATP
jgi:hypothetical protein